MNRSTEVLPDSHHRLWVTTGERTLYVELDPASGLDTMLSLRFPRVFNRVSITDSDGALR
jgi:hypothetical protein